MPKPEISKQRVTVYHLLQVREKYQGGKETLPSQINQINAIFSSNWQEPESSISWFEMSIFKVTVKVKKSFQAFLCHDPWTPVLQQESPSPLLLSDLNTLMVVLEEVNAWVPGAVRPEELLGKPVTEVLVGARVSCWYKPPLGCSWRGSEKVILLKPHWTLGVSNSFDSQWAIT